MEQGWIARVDSALILRFDVRKETYETCEIEILHVSVVVGVPFSRPAPGTLVYNIIQYNTTMASMLKDPLTVSLPDWFASSIIPLSAISGVVFALLLWYKVSQISVRGFSSRNGGREYLLEEEQGAESEVRDDFEIPTPNARVGPCCGLRGRGSGWCMTHISSTDERKPAD